MLNPKALFLFVAGSLLVITACTSNSTTDESAIVTKAVAQINPTQDNQVSGTVTFIEKTNQELEVVVSLSGLTPGLHGFHIHDAGDCSAPDGSSAGGHFNPAHHPHGDRNPVLHHMGDLGNITANSQGVVEESYTVDKLSLNGPDSILNRSIIVHADADDYITQPSGDSGARQACGLIQAQDASHEVSVEE